MKNFLYMTSAVGLISFSAGSMAFAQEADAPEPNAKKFDTIMVTATRREQGVQDVPAPIAVLGGADLEAQGAEGFEDYISTLPSVGFTQTQGGGGPKIGVRGVANVTGTDNATADAVATVGLYLGEVPISGSAHLPDLAIYDLNRVEVLKGPQGTLYGEGAMGGAIRLIPNSPDAGGIEGRGEYTLGSIKDGGLKHRARGVVNLPIIEDRAALRVVGSYSKSDGFVDNVVQGIEDIDSSTKYSVRATLGIDVSENIDLELMYLRDYDERDDFTDVDPTRLPDYQSVRLEDRYSERLFELYSMTANVDLGPVELVSSTSFIETERDYLPRFGGFDRSGTADAVLAIVDEAETFTQELRLVSQYDSPVQWILGGFYRDREVTQCGDLSQSNAAALGGGLPFPADHPCPPADQSNGFLLSLIASPDTFEQKAVYGNATFDVSDRLQVEAGFRWFDEDVGIAQDFVVVGALSFLTSSSDELIVNSSDTLFKAGLNYRFTDDILGYAVWGQGFRSGGPNLLSALSVNIPELFEPDTLDNYEVGLKTESFDGRLVLNFSAYFAEWENMQLNNFFTVGRPQRFIDNAADSELYGFDAEFTARPNDKLTLGGSLAYNHTEITRVEASTGIADGQELSNAPEWQASFNADYRFPVLDGQADAFVAGSFAYTSEQKPDLFDVNGNGLQSTTPLRILASREALNLRAGLDFDNWGFDVHVSNLLDDRLEYGLDEQAAGNNLVIGEPRVIGFTVRANY